MAKRLMWSTALLLLVAGGSTSASSNRGLGPVPVNLGSAGTFAILSQSGITDVYASAVVGDVGTSPITGAALLLTCGEVSGKVYTVDAAGPLPCAVTAPALLTGAIVQSSGCVTRPERSLGSNHVLLGGMMPPASATFMTSSSEVG